MTEFEAACGFTIERLRTFCRIAEAGSISLAAKGDLTRQSQFSRQVKELEEFFGTKLVERAGKTIRLTEDGRNRRPHAGVFPFGRRTAVAFPKTKLSASGAKAYSDGY